MSDEEAVRLYECARKERRFDTFAAASAHAWQVEQDPQRREWHGIGAYQCPWCDGYHIGRIQLRRFHGSLPDGSASGWSFRVRRARYYVKMHPSARSASPVAASLPMEEQPGSPAETKEDQRDQ